MNLPPWITDNIDIALLFAALAAFLKWFVEEVKKTIAAANEQRIQKASIENQLTKLGGEASVRSQDANTTLDMAEAERSNTVSRMALSLHETNTSLTSQLITLSFRVTDLEKLLVTAQSETALANQRAIASEQRAAAAEQRAITAERRADALQQRYDDLILRVIRIEEKQNAPIPDVNEQLSDTLHHGALGSLPSATEPPTSPPEDKIA